VEVSSVRLKQNKCTENFLYIIKHKIHGNLLMFAVSMSPECRLLNLPLYFIKRTAESFFFTKRDFENPCTFQVMNFTFAFYQHVYEPCNVMNFTPFTLFYPSTSIELVSFLKISILKSCFCFVFPNPWLLNFQLKFLYLYRLKHLIKSSAHFLLEICC
jgi:hypothetical protein